MTAVIDRCPACDAGTEPLLHRAAVPVHQNLPWPTAEAARAATRGELALRRCARCGLVGNAAFDDALLSYDRDYDNNQIASHVFGSHVDERIAELVTGGLRGKHVVEVGCGKGYFLARLCQAGGNTGVGYDATYDGPAELPGGQVRFVRAYYGGDDAAQRVDAVVCRHVIEHVANPVALLRSIRAALAASPGARLYFETPALEWILDGVVFWDLFYEHCCYFTEAALANMFRLAGLQPVAQRRVFGGQYQWLEARVAEPTGDALPVEPDHAGPAIAAFLAEEARRRQRWADSLAAMVGDGPVAIWGAGAKGVTFLNLLDPDGALVSMVVDINPRKQGRFVPGTGHPILAPAELARLGVRNVVLMNPNYLDEARTLLASIDPTIAVHTAETA